MQSKVKESKFYIILEQYLEQKNTYKNVYLCGSYFKYPIF